MVRYTPAGILSQASENGAQGAGYALQARSDLSGRALQKVKKQQAKAEAAAAKQSTLEYLKYQNRVASCPISLRSCCIVSPPWH